MCPLGLLEKLGVRLALHSDFTMAPAQVRYHVLRVTTVTCHESEYQRDNDNTQPLVLAWCAVNRVTLETGRTNHPELCLSPYTALRGHTAVLSSPHPACSLSRCDALSSRDPGGPGQARLTRGGQGGKPRRVGGKSLESRQNEDQRHQNIVQGVSRRQMLILRPKLNIPYGQSSAKLPVILSCHPVM